MRETKVAVIALFIIVCVQTPQSLAANIESIQQALASRGYEIGAVDGLLGPRTRQAVRAFQADNGLPVTGKVSQTLELMLTAPRPLPKINVATSEVAIVPKDADETRISQPADPKRKPVSKFANRNWLVKDLDGFGKQSGPIFALFLQDNGGVVGPRFAAQMQWSEDTDGNMKLTYENQIGMRIQRTGQLVSDNLINGQAEGREGHRWRWIAEAADRPNPRRVSVSENTN